MPTNSTTIKGFIAEEICKFHLQRAGFNIINSGKEWFDKDLADRLTQQAPKKKNATLNIFNNIIAKLPDFMIWRESDGSDEIEYKFVEVKYRANIDSKIFVPTVTQSGDKYLKYTCNDPKKDPLKVYKYMYNLERLMHLEYGEHSDLSKIEFYIYLVTSSDTDAKTNIYFGKVYGSASKGYKIYFYAPQEVSSKFGQVWTNYLDVAKHLLDTKVDILYKREPLFMGESYEYLQQQIKNIILN